MPCDQPGAEDASAPAQTLSLSKRRRPYIQLHDPGSTFSCGRRNRMADVAPEGIEILPDQFSHRLAAKMAIRVEMLGEALAKLAHLLVRRDSIPGHDLQKMAEAVGGELAALQNEGLFLALVLQRCLITEVLEAVESESTVLLEELG